MLRMFRGRRARRRDPFEERAQRLEGLVQSVLERQVEGYRETPDGRVEPCRPSLLPADGREPLRILYREDGTVSLLNIVTHRDGRQERVPEPDRVPDEDWLNLLPPVRKPSAEMEFHLAAYQPEIGGGDHGTVASDISLHSPGPAAVAAPPMLNQPGPTALGHSTALGETTALGHATALGETTALRQTTTLGQTMPPSQHQPLQRPPPLVYLQPPAPPGREPQLALLPDRYRTQGHLWHGPSLRNHPAHANPAFGNTAPGNTALGNTVAHPFEQHPSVPLAPPAAMPAAQASGLTVPSAKVSFLIAFLNEGPNASRPFYDLLQACAQFFERPALLDLYLESGRDMPAPVASRRTPAERVYLQLLRIYALRYFAAAVREAIETVDPKRGLAHYTGLDINTRFVDGQRRVLKHLITALPEALLSAFEHRPNTRARFFQELVHAESLYVEDIYMRLTSYLPQV